MPPSAAPASTFGRTSPSTTGCETRRNLSAFGHTLSSIPFPPSWLAGLKIGSGQAHHGNPRCLWKKSEDHRQTSSPSVAQPFLAVLLGPFLVFAVAQPFLAVLLSCPPEVSRRFNSATSIHTKKRAAQRPPFSPRFRGM